MKKQINGKIRNLLYASSLWNFGEGMLWPLFAVYTQRIGWDIFDISWAWATYLIVAGIMYIVVGKIADWKNSKDKIMILWYALNACFTFWYIFVSQPYHLFIVQIGLAIAAALATPTRNALYSENEDKNHGALEWWYADGLSQIMTWIALLIWWYIIEIQWFTVLFVIMWVVQVIATIYQAQILKIKKNK